MGRKADISEESLEHYEKLSLEGRSIEVRSDLHISDLS